MAKVEKKIWSKSFQMIRAGEKPFEIRVADFRIKKGDVFVLREWNPKTKRYTGKVLLKRVRFVQKFKLDEYGQRKLIEKKGLQVISF